MAVATHLITAEEYAQRDDRGCPTELVKGEVIELNQPVPRHGQVCGNVYFHVRVFLERHPVGHVVSNESGILTERDPDTVRGGDVWYVSYDKIPQGPLPSSYLEVPLDIVFEVKSPSDRWPRSWSTSKQACRSCVFSISRPRRPDCTSPTNLKSA
jgi:Uma2 family endonuclease